jgi:pantothenate kinase
MNTTIESDDSAMINTYEEMAKDIIEKSQSLPNNKQLLIGLCGCPGSGKTTCSSKLNSLIPNSVVIPMDGYHLYRYELDLFPDAIEAHARRGAHFTFNSNKFYEKMTLLKDNGYGLFPSFDHKIGDPIEDDIEVKNTTKVVIIEGLYLLLDIEPWNLLKDIFHYTIYIDVELSTLRNRIIKRHLKVGMDEVTAVHRVDNNDLINATEIILNKNRADKIILSL